MKPVRILVIDDEPDIRNLVCEILEDEGFNVALAENAVQARQLLESFKPALILLDVWLPNVDGITLLKEWKENQHVTPSIIMMSGHGNVETAVEATRHGAYDFIEKPLSIEKLLLTIRQALEKSSLQYKSRRLTYINSTLEPVGKSKIMTTLRQQLAKIASHKTPVLIHGEAGVGKESYARYLHSLSPNKHGPFIVANFSKANEERAEFELFGTHAKQQLGYLDKAANGTLFIKDIAELSNKLQLSLQHVLEVNKYSHIGSSAAIALNTRIIAATRFNLEALISDGKFLAALFYQLNVLPILIPPLREHYEDIPALLEYYVNYFIETEGLPYKRFNIAAQNSLRSYHWPGNIRELKNLVQRLLVLGTEEVIDVNEVDTALAHLQHHLAAGPFNFNLPLRDAREHFEKAYFEYQLEKANGNVSQVATRVGIERTHLYRKLKALKIELK